VKHLIRLALATTVLLPFQGQACEKIVQLVYSAQGAILAVTVNGLPVVNGASSGSVSGAAQMAQWLNAGQNTAELVVSAHPEGTDTAATVEIVAACRGEMIDFRGGNEGALATLTQDGAGSRSVSFEVDAAPETTFSDAVAAGDDGLTDALAALTAAFSDGDIDTIIAMHGPMLGMAGLMGMPDPEAMFRGMLGGALKNGKLAVADAVEISTSTDGRFFAVIGAADGTAPLVLLVEESGGSSRFSTGKYWARIDGAWVVISN